MTDDFVFDADCEARARAVFAELQMLLEIATETDEQADSQYELITDMQEWAVAHSQPNDRHAAYIVVLKDNFRDEAAADMTRLLCRIWGVTSVVPIEDDYSQVISAERYRSKISRQLQELAREVGGY